MLSASASACINDVCTEHHSPTSTLLGKIASELGSDGSTAIVGTIDKIVLAYYDSSSGNTTEYSDLSWSVATSDWTTGTGIQCTDTNSDGLADTCTVGTNYVCKTATVSGAKTVNRLRAYSGTDLYFEISFTDTSLADQQEVKVCFYVGAKMVVDGANTTFSKVAINDHVYTQALRDRLTVGSSTKLAVVTAKFFDSGGNAISGSLTINRSVSGTTATVNLLFTPDGTTGNTTAVFSVNVFPDTTNTTSSDGLEFSLVDPSTNTSEYNVVQGVTNQLDIVFEVSSS